MAVYYIETSALVKLYVHEPGTDEMLRLLAAPPRDQFVILGLSAVEFRAALRRRQRAGDLPKAAAERILQQFQQHSTSRFMRQLVSDSVMETAAMLADNHPIRAAAALQLAGCHALRYKGSADPVFVCADPALCDAARREGFPALNPLQ